MSKKPERIDRCPYCEFGLNYDDLTLFSLDEIDDRDWVREKIESDIVDIYEPYDIECPGCDVVLIFEIRIAWFGENEHIDWLFNLQEAEEVRSQTGPQ